MKFSTGYGVLIILLEIQEEWGGYFLVQESGNSREVRGFCMKFLPWWEYGYFPELHVINTDHLKQVQLCKEEKIDQGTVCRLLLCSNV